MNNKKEPETISSFIPDNQVMFDQNVSDKINLLTQISNLLDTVEEYKNLEKQLYLLVELCKTQQKMICDRDAVILRLLSICNSLNSDTPQ